MRGQCSSLLAGGAAESAPCTFSSSPILCCMFCVQNDVVNIDIGRVQVPNYPPPGESLSVVGAISHTAELSRITHPRSPPTPAPPRPSSRRGSRVRTPSGARVSHGLKRSTASSSWGLPSMEKATGAQFPGTSSSRAHPRRCGGGSDVGGKGAGACCALHFPAPYSLPAKPLPAFLPSMPISHSSSSAQITLCKPCQNRTLQAGLPVFQVASHAQKYFIRLNSQNKKDKRRASIHDITTVAPTSAAPGTLAATMPITGRQPLGGGGWGGCMRACVFQQEGRAGSDRAHQWHWACAEWPRHPVQSYAAAWLADRRALVCVYAGHNPLVSGSTMLPTMSSVAAGVAVMPVEMPPPTAAHVGAPPMHLH
jgi:hypothetical protein